MKKIYSLIIFSLFLFTGERSFSQSFSFVNHDTTACGSVSSDVECFVGDSILNNTANSVMVDVVRVQDDTATAGWTSAFCVNGQCYLPNKDSVRFTLTPHQFQSFIVHFYTSATAGTGTVLFKVKDVNTPSVVAYQHFHGSSLCTGINEPFANSANVCVYPSPLVSGNDFTMNITSLPAGQAGLQNAGKEISLFVYNIYGSAVTRINNLKEGNNTLNLNLPAGIYSYCLISDNASVRTGKLAVGK